MSIEAKDIWEEMPIGLKKEVIEELILTCKEIISDSVRKNNATTSNKKSCHLCETINTESSHIESGKPTITICGLVHRFAHSPSCN